jgi:hypothetical protein
MAERQQWVVAIAQSQLRYPAELSPATSEDEALDVVANVSAGVWITTARGVFVYISGI